MLNNYVHVLIWFSLMTCITVTRLSLQSDVENAIVHTNGFIQYWAAETDGEKWGVRGG